MMHLAESMKMGTETRRLFAYLARPTTANPLLGADPAEACRRVLAVIEPLVRHAGLPGFKRHALRWFGTDLARAAAAFRGRELVLELEAVMAKWHRFGIEPNTMQLLLGEVWTELDPAWAKAGKEASDAGAKAV